MRVAQAVARHDLAQAPERGEAVRDHLRRPRAAGGQQARRPGLPSDQDGRVFQPDQPRATASGAGRAAATGEPAGPRDQRRDARGQGPGHGARAAADLGDVGRSRRITWPSCMGTWWGNTGSSTRRWARTNKAGWRSRIACGRMERRRGRSIGCSSDLCGAGRAQAGVQSPKSKVQSPRAPTAGEGRRL